jgi:hypothetical protein
MDAILTALHAFRETNDFAAWQHVGRHVVLGLGVIVFIAATFSEADVLADVRAALRLAGLSDKAAAADMAVNQGLCSQKLHGDRPLTIRALSLLPTEFWRWFAVVTAQRHGVPVMVTAGARLARRQARMSVPRDPKAGVA